MKDLEILKEHLKKVHNELFVAERLRENAIERELEKLDELLLFLGDALPKEKINQTEGVLIYAFEANNKRTISNKVYYCDDKKVRYQVYKKEEYLGYNPTATFEGSYAVVEAGEMFKEIGLEDVIEFFTERLIEIPKLAEKIKADTTEKTRYL